MEKTLANCDGPFIQEKLYKLYICNTDGTLFKRQQCMDKDPFVKRIISQALC